MHDDKTVQRFIELRVQGCSFAQIATELKVTKATLIGWSHKHQHTIANLTAIERENRLQQQLTSGEERMRKLGDQIRFAEAELAKRDLATLSTGRLLNVGFAGPVLAVRFSVWPEIDGIESSSSLFSSSDSPSFRLLGQNGKNRVSGQTLFRRLLVALPQSRRISRRRKPASHFVAPKNWTEIFRPLFGIETV